MRNTINRIVILVVCVLLSGSLLFQRVSAEEVDATTKTVVTNSPIEETSPIKGNDSNEIQEEFYSENTPIAQLSEPDTKSDGF